MTAILGILAGVLLIAAAVGWIWIVVLAFGNGEPLWGLGCLIISPLAFVYGLMNYEEAKIPLWLLVAGFITNIIVQVILVTSGGVAAA